MKVKDSNVFMIIKILVIVIVLVFIIKMIPSTLSRYEMDTIGDADIQYAFYLLEANYYTEEVKLGDIIPRDDAYVYNFTVSNYKEDKRSEVNMEYDLVIRTTTNLPLEYELYLEDDFDTNIIVSNEVVIDEDGTYFRILKIDKRYFSMEDDEMDSYHLYVYFPSIYKDSMYQDIVESVEIGIDSRQVIS